MATTTLLPPTTIPTPRICPCATGGYSNLPCCRTLQTRHTRIFAMHLTQLRAAARNLTAPPPPSRTPTLVTPPKEGYLFHLEGQNLVAAFNRACVDGGCSPGERAALYERCVLRGGLREVVEAQEEKVRRGHERARGIVREERREVRPEVAGVGSVVHAWEGPADGRRADGVVRAGVADAAFERAMVDARYAAIVDSWVTTMTGPRDWPIANAVLDATITDVELDGSTVGVFFDLPMAGVAFDGATMAEVVVAEAPPPPPARVSYADMARRAVQAGS